MGVHAFPWWVLCCVGVRVEAQGGLKANKHDMKRHAFLFVYMCLMEACLLVMTVCEKTRSLLPCQELKCTHKLLHCCEDLCACTCRCKAGTERPTNNNNATVACFTYDAAYCLRNLFLFQFLQKAVLSLKRPFACQSFNPLTCRLCVPGERQSSRAQASGWPDRHAPSRHQGSNQRRYCANGCDYA
jgi:hypothetical protein